MAGIFQPGGFAGPPMPGQFMNPAMNFGTMLAGFAQGNPLGGFQTLGRQQQMASAALVNRQLMDMRMRQFQQEQQRQQRMVDAATAMVNPLAAGVAPDVMKEQTQALTTLAQGAPELILQAGLQRLGLGGAGRYKTVGKQLYDVQTGEWISPPGGVTEPADFSDVTNMRKEFTKESVPWTQTRDAFERIRASRPTGAGDINLLTSFMKMIDPGSVVREGEFATAANAGGIPERIRNTYNSLLRGDRLSDVQRAEFKNQASALLDVQRKRQIRRETDYSGIAQRFNARPEDVVRDMLSGYREGVPTFGEPEAEPDQVPVSPQSESYMQQYGNP